VEMMELSGELCSTFSTSLESRNLPTGLYVIPDMKTLDQEMDDGKEDEMITKG
jgi:hypothetical protein